MSTCNEKKNKKILQSVWRNWYPNG